MEPCRESVNEMGQDWRGEGEEEWSVRSGTSYGKPSRQVRGTRSSQQ
jgi:hypothetical protein